MNRYGHLKLRAALKTESTRENSLTTSINSSHSVNGKRKVVMQCSSFASIMPSISQRKNRNGFLYELQQSLLYPRSPSSTSSSSSSVFSGEVKSTANSSEDVSYELKWPSKAMVHNAIDPQVGGCIPLKPSSVTIGKKSEVLDYHAFTGTLEKTAWDPLFVAMVRQYDATISRREKLPPHFKSYFSSTQSRIPSHSLDYFLMTSHNLSKQAWGSMEINRSVPYRIVIFCRYDMHPTLTLTLTFFMLCMVISFHHLSLFLAIISSSASVLLLIIASQSNLNIASKATKWVY